MSATSTSVPLGKISNSHVSGNSGRPRVKVSKCPIRGCGRRHRGGEAKCWVAHPELKPDHCQSTTATRGSGGHRAPSRGRGRGRGGDGRGRHVITTQDAWATGDSSDTAAALPLPKAEVFPFLKLPQEIQDQIYQHYYDTKDGGYEVTAEYAHQEGLRRRNSRSYDDLEDQKDYMKLHDFPCLDLERTCHKIHNDAMPIRKSLFNGSLTICYDDYHGFKALDKLILKKELDWLLKSVTKLHVSGFSGRTFRFGSMSVAVWESIVSVFPAAREVHAHFNVTKHVYTDRHSDSPTTEFSAGLKDHEFSYPAGILKVQGLAKLLEDNGRGDCEVYMSTYVRWLAHYYRSVEQTCVAGRAFGIVSSDLLTMSQTVTFRVTPELLEGVERQG